MATTELTGSGESRFARPLTLRDLGEQTARAYLAGWTMLLAVAGICAIIPTARWLAHHELALELHVRIHPAPAPTLHTALELLVTNVRATGWPLLATVFGAQQPTLLRRTVHAAVAISLAANLLPVAAAIGVYRSALLPYLPHLPLELYAITTGPNTWLLSTRQTLTRRQLTLITVSILTALTAAALLETWAIPHQ